MPTIPRINRHVISKSIVRVILPLQPAQSLQPPRLVPIDRLQRLVAIGIVDVVRRPAPVVPQIADGVRPLGGGLAQRRVRRDGRDEVQDVVLVPVRVRARVVRERLHGLGRVALVEDRRARPRQFRVESGVGVEEVVDGALSRHVVGLEEGVGEGFARGLAAATYEGGALGDGDLGVGDVADLLGQGSYFVERLEERLGFVGGTSVSECPPDCSLWNVSERVLVEGVRRAKRPTEVLLNFGFMVNDP